MKSHMRCLLRNHLSESKLFAWPDNSWLSKTRVNFKNKCPAAQIMSPWPTGCLQNWWFTQTKINMELSYMISYVLPQLTYENLLYPATLCYQLHPANLCYVHCIFQQLERHQTTFPKLTVASDPDSVPWTIKPQEPHMFPSLSENCLCWRHIHEHLWQLSWSGLPPSIQSRFGVGTTLKGKTLLRKGSHSSLTHQTHTPPTSYT